MMSEFKQIKNIGIRSLISCAVLIAGTFLESCEKLERSEEVPFEGNAFAFEMRSKTTIETTLHYRKIVFRRAGSNDEKILVGTGSLEMDVFPAIKNQLEGVEYSIIDTVARTRDKLPPTQESHTLYLDPEVFTKDDYNTVVKFVKSCYEQPIEKNKIIEWLDADVLGLEDGGIYYSVYAIVHKKLSDLEPEYHATEDKDYVRVKVNNRVWVSSTSKDGLEMAGFDYTLRNDSLFYPDYYIDKAAIDRQLTFKDKNGELFGARAKVLIAEPPH